MVFQSSRLALYWLASYWKRALAVFLVAAVLFSVSQWIQGWQRPQTAEIDRADSVRERIGPLANRFGEPAVRQGLVDARLAIPRLESEFVYKLGFVYDGDTLYSASNEKIRLYGIDAPELAEKCASEATHELRRMVLSGFLVEEGPRQTDQSGRTLYYLYTSDGESIDLHMVVNGFALALGADGQHAPVLAEAERLAREHRVGCLWG